MANYLLPWTVRVTLDSKVEARPDMALLDKSEVSPENDTNASSRQDNENKTGDFLKKCSIQKLWRHLLTLSVFGGLVGLFGSS